MYVSFVTLASNMDNIIGSILTLAWGRRRGFFVKVKAFKEADQNLNLT